MYDPETIDQLVAAELARIAAERERWERERYKNSLYVVFVLSGEEKTAMNEIRRYFGNDVGDVYSPQIELPFKRIGIITIEHRFMFPGYLFVESDIPLDEFVIKIADCARHSEVILKQLNYGDWKLSAIPEHERCIFDSFLNETKDFILTSKGYKDGSTVVITEGPLVGKREMIRKIDRHKMIATVEITLLDKTCRLNVGLILAHKPVE